MFGGNLYGNSVREGQNQIWSCHKIPVDW